MQVSSSWKDAFGGKIRSWNESTKGKNWQETACLSSYTLYMKYVFNLLCLWLFLYLLWQAVSHTATLMLRSEQNLKKSQSTNINCTCTKYLPICTNTHTHTHASSAEVPERSLVQCSVVIINNWPSKISPCKTAHEARYSSDTEGIKLRPDPGWVWVIFRNRPGFTSTCTPRQRR